MSLSPISRQLLRRHLLQPAFTQATRVQLCRAQWMGRRWYAEGGGQERESFKGQLYHSTHERVQRERADQERFAEYREAQKSSRSLGIVVPIVLAAGVLGGWMLGRQKPPQLDLSSTTPLATITAPQFDTSSATMQAAWADFKEIVGEENVSMDQTDLEMVKGSEWSTYTAKKEEIHYCIVRPGSTEDVSEIMKVCHKRKIPVTGYAGGTSLEGHFAATRGGVCVDFSRMDQILALHAEDLDVVVQPAVGWELLNEELGEHNLFFPPDPGPGAQIGGMINTGCSGTNAYRYGTMKDWVIGVTVVLADGTIVKTKQRPRKSSAGYDLTRTFVGSEGTLGLVTEATLKVTPKPQNTSVAVCTFPDIRSAADCVFRVVGAGVPIAAVEILDDVQMKCINYVGSTQRKWSEVPTLFFKFAGTKQAVDEHVQIVKEHAKAAGNKTFEFASNKQEQEELWEARKQALWSVMAQKKDDSDHVWTTDVAVPISRLPDIIDETKKDLSESGLTGAIVGHVGDGNFHAIILYNDKEYDVADDLVHQMVKRAIEMEGTATGEHGVGLIKRDYLSHELSESTVDLMRKIKRALDPQCLLNCDKVIRSQQPKKGEVAEW